MKTGKPPQHRKAAEVLKAYRTWLSPKTTETRASHRAHRIAVQEANIKARDERRRLAAKR